MTWKRRIRWILLGLVALPPATWILVVLLFQTDCARDRLSAVLAKQSGRSVRIERMRLCILGGIRLQNLEIAEPARSSDPWLRAAEIRLDLGIRQILAQRWRPQQVEVRGVRLRIERGKDGKLEIADLLRSNGDARHASSGSVDNADSSPVKIVIHQAQIHVVDGVSQTQLDLDGMEGTATWQPRRVVLDGLRGQLNGGQFEVAAQLDRGPGSPQFEGQLGAHQVGVGPGTPLVRYLAPVLDQTLTSVDGRLDLNLYLRGHGDAAQTVRESLAGQGNFTIDPVSLRDSKLIAELAKLDIIPKGGEVGSIRGTFAVADGRVSTRDLCLQVGATPILFVGWTDFQGQLDYRIHASALSQRVVRELRGVIDDLPDELGDLFQLRVGGTLGNLLVTLDGMPIGNGKRFDPSRLSIEKTKLREIGRRLKNRVLR
jgi:uncharacterized protein involved in outer membrane biogenesis